MKIPFLYYNKRTFKYYVYFGLYDYMNIETGWMADENLPEGETLTNSLDMVESYNIFEFQNEADALQKMKELWAIVEI